ADRTDRRLDRRRPGREQGGAGRRRDRARRGRVRRLRDLRLPAGEENLDHPRGGTRTVSHDGTGWGDYCGDRHDDPVRGPPWLRPRSSTAPESDRHCGRRRPPRPGPSSAARLAPTSPADRAGPGTRAGSPITLARAKLTHCYLWRPTIVAVKWGE